MKFKFFTLIIPLFLIAAIMAAFFVLNKKDNNDEYGSIKNITNDSKYKTIYYCQTKYDNHSFDLLDAYAVNEGMDVLYVSSDINQEVDKYSDPYDYNIPTNKLIKDTISEDEYEETIDDYASFKNSITATTIIYMKSDNDKPHAITFIEKKASRIEVLISKTLKMVKTLPDDVFSMPEQTEKNINTYLTKNKFKKVEV